MGAKSSACRVIFIDFQHGPSENGPLPWLSYPLLFPFLFISFCVILLFIVSCTSGRLSLAERDVNPTNIFDKLVCHIISLFTVIYQLSRYYFYHLYYMQSRGFQLIYTIFFGDMTAVVVLYHSWILYIVNPRKEKRSMVHMQDSFYCTHYLFYMHYKNKRWFKKSCHRYANSKIIKHDFLFILPGKHCVR